MSEWKNLDTSWSTDNAATFGLTMNPAFVVGAAAFFSSSSEPLLATDAFVCFLLARILGRATSEIIDEVTLHLQAYSNLQKIENLLDKTEIPNWRAWEVFGHDHPGLQVIDGHRYAIETNQLVLAADTGETVLRGVNINILPGSITMVIGNIAVGKSLLLRAILGEVWPLAGQITLCSNQAGYSGQESWIPNQSMQDIIIGQYEFVSHWYRKVVRACCLEQDFARLPDEDFTLAGSGGCNLTNSQKQRLVSSAICISISI